MFFDFRAELLLELRSVGVEVGVDSMRRGEAPASREEVVIRAMLRSWPKKLLLKRAL